MVAFARVAVFIQRGAVKRGERKIIRRKMARHPIQNNVKPRGVRGVDKVAEILPGTEATGGRVQPGRLIAPAAVKRMLVNRQQFEVGKAHPFGIRDQLVGKLAIAQPEVIIGVAAPGAEMYFINRDRRIKLVSLLALRRLCDLFRQPADERGALRAHLRFKSVRVGLHPQVAVGIDKLEFIQLAVQRAGNKQLPDAGLFTQAHRVAAAVPVVKLADDRYPAGIRRPYGETRTDHAVHGIGMRAQRFIRTQMRAFRQQPDIKILQQRTKTVRVINQVLLPVPGDGQLIAKRIFTTRQNAAEETARVEAFQLADFASGFWFNDPHIGGIG